MRSPLPTALVDTVSTRAPTNVHANRSVTADHSVTRLSVLTIVGDGIERMSVEGGTTQ
jgi:hypothetical protein